MIRRFNNELPPKRRKFNHEPCIIIEDNVMTDEEYDIVMKEIKESKTFERKFNNNVQYNRFYLDNTHKSLKIIEKIIYKREWWDQAIGYPDACWCTPVPNYEASVTYYNNNDKYTWHTDHAGSIDNNIIRALNFILYLTDEGFTGGETDLSLETGDFIADETPDISVWKTVKPKKKRFLMFPSYMLHRVNKIILKDNNVQPWEKRLTINGHMRYGVNQ